MPSPSESAAVRAALACLLLAGCASPPPPKALVEPPPVIVAPPPAVVAPPPDPIAAATRRLADYYARLAALRNGALAEEIARLRAEPARPESAIELATALSLTRASGDAARALQVLEPLLQSTDAASEPWRTLATMLAASLAEQRHLDELSARQAQQLRESQRRIDQANEKIEALRAIERSLGARPAAPGLPKDPP